MYQRLVKTKYLFLLPVLLELSGCATTRDCDPRFDPGFIGGINCHASDAYQGRINEDRKILDDERMLRDRLDKQKGEAIQERKNTESAVRAAQSDLRNMDEQLDAMEANLRQSRRGNKALQARLAHCRTTITQLKKAASAGNASLHERSRLRGELKKAQDELMRMTGGGGGFK